MGTGSGEGVEEERGGGGGGGIQGDGLVEGESQGRGQGEEKLGRMGSRKGAEGEGEAGWDGTGMKGEVAQVSCGQRGGPARGSGPRQRFRSVWSRRLST